MTQYFKINRNSNSLNLYMTASQASQKEKSSGAYCGEIALRANGNGKILSNLFHIIQLQGSKFHR